MAQIIEDILKEDGISMETFANHEKMATTSATGSTARSCIIDSKLRALTIDGGLGTDRADYARSLDQVVINLSGSTFQTTPSVHGGVVSEPVQK